LLIFLGDGPLALVTALTIPFAVLFAFGLMSGTGRSANLISIGAIDFGIIVDSAIVVLENIYRRMHEATSDEQELDRIAEGTGEAAKPVLFATLIILVAFIPLFTMQGVPGKIFAPMSVTYGFALTGALIFALVFAPVLTDLLAKPADREDWTEEPGERAQETRLSRFFARHYRRWLDRVFATPGLVWVVAASALIGAALLFVFAVGGEYMPPLEEGNLWTRATLPPDVAFTTA